MKEGRLLMVGISLVTLFLSRLCLSFCLACASSLVNCDMLDDHCYKAFIAKFAAKGFSLGCYFFLLVCVCVCVPAQRVCCSLCLVIVAGFVWGPVCPHICCAWIGWDWGRCCFGVCVVCVVAITGVDMCKVCTEAVQSVALWTRVTLQVWTCVKYVLKQSTP